MSQKLLMRLLFILLLLQIAFYISSLIGREPDIDDAWVGEHAFWMAQDGHARSELMRGWIHQEERNLIHHKLMTLQGWLIIEIFGFSLFALKSGTLFFFLLFIVVFYIYVIRKKKILDNQQFLIALLILFTFHFTFKFSFIFRPEILIMFLTFIVYILLEKVITDKRQTWYIGFIAGIVSGLCIVTHLNGIATAAAGGLLLLVNKKFKQIPLYIAGVSIGFSLYFYDFSSEYGFDFWKNQLFNSILGHGSGRENLIVYMLKSFSKEHMRFFHDPSIVSFSFLLIFIFITGFRYLKRNHGLMLQFTFILWFLIAILFTQKSRQYILVYLPYLIIFMTVILDKLIKGDYGLSKWAYKKSANFTLGLLVVFFIISSNVFNYKTSMHKFNPGMNRIITEKIIKEDPSTIRIIAPMEFIFNEITHYKSIQGERLYTTLQNIDKSIYGEGALRKANEFGIDYMILSPLYRKDLGLEFLKEGDTFANYSVIYYTSEMSILKRESALSHK